MSIFIIGFIRIRSVLSKLSARIDFLAEYRENYVKLANSVSRSDFSMFARPSNIDPQLYHWLTLNAARAQREVGIFGVGEFVAPFQIYKVRNYQFIVNTLPKFRDDRIMPQEITMVDDILVRCIGYFEEAETSLKKTIANPLKWFQYGIRFLVSFPARILSWFGIISEGMFDSITANGLFKFVSGVVALIGFVSAIVGLITGWDNFIEIVKGWWS
ncbi:MAG: hypothetical protein R2813_04450 [Flavobacteriales bacterium]